MQKEIILLVHGYIIVIMVKVKVIEKETELVIGRKKVKVMKILSCEVFCFRQNEMFKIRNFALSHVVIREMYI